MPVCVRACAGSCVAGHQTLCVCVRARARAYVCMYIHVYVHIHIYIHVGHVPEAVLRGIKQRLCDVDAAGDCQCLELTAEDMIKCLLREEPTKRAAILVELTALCTARISRLSAVHLSLSHSLSSLNG